MMTKTRLPDNAFIKIFAFTAVCLLIGIIPTFGQNKNLNNNGISVENGWWKPVLQKHKIDLDKFNYRNTFNMGMNDTVNDLWLEMGNSDSLNKRNIPFKDAIFISKGAGQTYWILTSEYARHDLDNNIIFLKNGKSACYDFIFENVIPTQSFSFQEGSIDIKKNTMMTKSIK